MPTLDDIRTRAEAGLEKLLSALDQRHKKALRAAIKRYGRVQDIPEIFWVEMQREIEQEQIAAIALLILAGDEWTADELRKQGVVVGKADRNKATRQADDQLRETSSQTVDTIRKRLARKIEDSRTTGPGGVGELTDEGIDDSLEAVFDEDRRKGIATDETTVALTKGQREAAGRGDGARTETGQRVEIEQYWSTELDDRVCPRCSPLHDQPESVWGRVFPNGPGPEAHPNCRCSLRPVVVVSISAQESEAKGRWITIKGNPVKISDNGTVLTGPMKGMELADKDKDRETSDNLDDDERNAIEDYTTDKFQTVNKALRNDGPLKGETKEIVSRIDSALEKAPKYKGGAVFRKFDADDTLIAQLQVGKTFSDKAFISTSKDKPAFVPKGTVALQIVGKSGVDISSLSLHGAAEKEVLFPRDAKFKVVKTKQHEHGGWAAILQEI